MPYLDEHLPGHLAGFLVKSPHPSRRGALPQRASEPAVAQPGPPVAGASPLVGDEEES